MPQIIHAKNSDDGIRFRVWSTVYDSYTTDEMDERGLREWTLQEAVCAAISSHLRGIDDRIARAKNKGTSSQLGDTRNLDGPWDQEREH